MRTGNVYSDEAPDDLRVPHAVRKCISPRNGEEFRLSV